MTGLLKSHGVSYTHHFQYVFLEREKWASRVQLWDIFVVGTEVCRRDGGCSLKDAGWHGLRAQFPSEWCSASESSEQRVTELKHQEISRFTKKSSQMVPAAIHTSRSNCGVFHSLPGFFHVKNPRGEHFQWLLAFLDHDPKLWRVGELMWTTSHMGSVCLCLGAISDGGLSWLRDCTWLYRYCTQPFDIFLPASWKSPMLEIPTVLANWYVMEWDVVFFFAKKWVEFIQFSWESHSCLCSSWGGTCDASWITSWDDVFFIIEAMKGCPGAYEKFPRFRFEQRHGCLGRVRLRFIITGKILKWSQTAWLRTVPFQLQAGRCSRPQSRNCANDVGLLNLTKDSWCCFGEVSHWGIIFLLMLHFLQNEEQSRSSDIYIWICI